MIKKGFDFSVALLLIFFLSPPMLVIGFLVFINMGSPIIFKQERTGLNGKLFTLYKFRTMHEPQSVNVSSDDSKRLTQFGKFLRSTSIDELPELINVIKGDMSLVGPRPLLVEYLPLYSPEQFRRHHVMPGITGLAQVNGRNTITWEEKFMFDVWYVDNHSFFLDIKILVLTLIKVLKRDGINESYGVTMSKFEGTMSNNFKSLKQ